MNARAERLRQLLADAGAEAYFSFSPPANEYLAGFRGTTSAVLITVDTQFFFCDFRYAEQADAMVSGYAIEVCNSGLEKFVGERLHDLGIQHAAFDPGVLTVEQQATVAAQATATELVSAPGLLAGLRQHKDPEEIAKLRAANDLAEGVLADLLPELREGIEEREFAARMEYEFKRRGAQGSSFAPIVLFGSRSSLPHGVPGGKPLERGDVVLLDFGCILGSYCSDLTRTYAFGTIPGAWFEEIYAVTLQAQLAALELVCPGTPCAAADAAARDIIAAAGFGDYFGHGLGHGVGLEVHEGPRLNRLSQATLEPGMVVTVEPGIYLPGQGGVRIEDLVVVTETGCDILSKTPKELKVLNA
ncbi:MAG: M24 family metallopeptidase [Candidatus Hydrogenedens sp.]|nr:M24 family metallopeptidase [Candidatus Hydrogenedens sp.]